MNVTSDSMFIAVGALIIAGIAVIGGVVELCRQRIIVDQATGNQISVEIPLFGKFKTNYPSLGAIILGVVIVWLVIGWFNIKIEKIPLTATVTFQNSNSHEIKTAEVFLSVIPQRYKRSQTGIGTNEQVDIKLEVDKGEGYDVIVYTPVSMRPDGTFQKVMQFGPMKTEFVDGHEIGTYKARLILE